MLKAGLPTPSPSCHCCSNESVIWLAIVIRVRELLVYRQFMRKWLYGWSAGRKLGQLCWLSNYCLISFRVY